MSFPCNTDGFKAYVNLFPHLIHKNPVYNKICFYSFCKQISKTVRNYHNCWTDTDLSGTKTCWGKRNNFGINWLKEDIFYTSHTLRGGDSRLGLLDSLWMSYLVLKWLISKILDDNAEYQYKGSTKQLRYKRILILISYRQNNDITSHSCNRRTIGWLHIILMQIC